MPTSPESWGEGGDRGELAEAAFAGNEMEAEVIQGLLESGGIPSLLQSTGFNGPHVLTGGLSGARPDYSGGSQRVMVHANRLEEAQALLAETLVADEEEEWPEIANARHLEGRRNRGPRNYGFIGAYARIYAVAIFFFAVVLGLYLLSRAT